MGKKRKTAYKVTNWREYNESLVRRGDITLWFDEDALATWEHANEEVKRGRPFTYSDTAIECLLMLRELFRLPYRQTEGLGRALVQLMDVDVPIPSFTLLAKRAARLKTSLDVSHTRGPIDMVVDSTGLKVVGEGEWRSAAYQTCRRKTWRKLHLSINPETQEIMAEVLTTRSKVDAESVPELLKQVDQPIDKFYGDGAYDRWAVHEQLEKQGIAPIIPPQRGAVIKQHGNCKAKPLARDEAVRRIRRTGRSSWKREIGYHRRSLVETSMFRLKQAFGNRLKNKAFENQRIEVRLRCKLLNHFTQLGMPKSKWN
ncbi:IS5 family transposase [Aeoliella sp.]|uniref:IS5 family transposase n=1 Tax=Aeoliella sp. TaxID=2795800 RepID=UPI003CCBD41C